MVYRADIIDFVQCASYLGADDHQLNACRRDQAIEVHESFRWFCARTRLKCDVPTSVEAFTPGDVLCTCAPLVICFANRPAGGILSPLESQASAFHRSAAKPANSTACGTRAYVRLGFRGKELSSSTRSLLQKTGHGALCQGRIDCADVRKSKTLPMPLRCEGR